MSLCFSRCGWHLTVCCSAADITDWVLKWAGPRWHGPAVLGGWGSGGQVPLCPALPSSVQVSPQLHFSTAGTHFRVFTTLISDDIHFWFWLIFGLNSFLHRNAKHLSHFLKMASSKVFSDQQFKTQRRTLLYRIIFFTFVYNRFTINLMFDLISFVDFCKYVPLNLMLFVFKWFLFVCIYILRSVSSSSINLNAVM